MRLFSPCLLGFLIFIAQPCAGQVIDDAASSKRIEVIQKEIQDLKDKIAKLDVELDQLRPPVNPIPVRELKSPVLLPSNGVADPAHKVGFFPNVEGGIDAVDLTNGKCLWKSKDAQLPLLATADRLFAQKNLDKPNQFRVVVLDTSMDGKVQVESNVIDLPDWVSVNVTYGRKYFRNARLDKNSLWLSWEAGAFYQAQDRPTPEMVKRARKEAGGVERMDVASGKIESLARKEFPRQDDPFGEDLWERGSVDFAQVFGKEKFPKFFPVVPTEFDSRKVGAMTFTLRDGPGKNANAVDRRLFEELGIVGQRVVQAVNAQGIVVWEREIAVPVFLLPRRWER